MERDTERVDAARLAEMERIGAGKYPGVVLVDAHLDHNAEHGQNPELIDQGDVR